MDTDVGVRFAPERTYQDLPHPYAVVVPGGRVATVRALSDPVLRNHVRTAASSAEIAGSVCTGSLVLAAHGNAGRPSGDDQLVLLRRPGAVRRHYRRKTVGGRRQRRHVASARMRWSPPRRSPTCRLARASSGITTSSGITRTDAARTKRVSATASSVRRSVTSWAPPLHSHAGSRSPTRTAEAESIPESEPNPMRGTNPARMPAAMATAPSTTLSAMEDAAGSPALCQLLAPIVGECRCLTHRSRPRRGWQRDGSGRGNGVAGEGQELLGRSDRPSDSSRVVSDDIAPRPMGRHSRRQQSRRQARHRRRGSRVCSSSVGRRINGDCHRHPVMTVLDRPGGSTRACGRGPASTHRLAWRQDVCRVTRRSRRTSARQPEW